MTTRLLTRANVRRRRFQLLRDGYKTNTALSDALGEGFAPSYVSQLLSGHRNIGDEVADKIEAALKLPFGLLDTPIEQKIEAEDLRLLEEIRHELTLREVPLHIRETIRTLLRSAPSKPNQPPQQGVESKDFFGTAPADETAKTRAFAEKLAQKK